MHAANVTPSDTQNLPAGTDYVSFINSGTQTIQITTLGGEIIALSGLASGALHPIRATRVWATNTTVTNVVVYWH